MYMRLGMKNTLVVSSPEMAKELFKTQDLTFSHRPELIVTDLLITTKQGTPLPLYEHRIALYKVSAILEHPEAFASNSGVTCRHDVDEYFEYQL